MQSLEIDSMYPRRPGQPSTPSWFPWAVFFATALVVMFIVPRFGWMSLLLFVWLGIPLLRRVLNSVASNYAARNASPEDEKAKSGETDDRPGSWANPARAWRAPSAYAAEHEESEKPKRRPEYVVGDDGELVEVEPVAEAEEPRRGQSNGSFYV
jgi:hypothetical protein